MAYLNCWEHKQCGREPGGSGATQFGICPAAEETLAYGINDGKNGGRICWAIAGTLCGGEIQGSLASKISRCEQCDFYLQVQAEEGLSFTYDCKSLRWLLSGKKAEKVMFRIMVPVAAAITLLLFFSILTCNSLVHGDARTMQRMSAIITGGHCLVFAALFLFFHLYLGRIKQEFSESDNLLSHEISERLLVENELRNANEFLTKVIHSSVDGIIAADLKGNIIIFNEGAERLLGYRAKDTIGHVHITALYPPGMAKEIMRQIREAPHGAPGKLPTTPTTLIARDGEEIPVNISAAIVYKGEEEIASVGIFTDLRERLQMQERLDSSYRQLFQSEKLSSLGTLAAGVAHEINNPLNNVSLSCQILMEDMEVLRPDERNEQLQWIEKQVDKASDIVRVLLEFSREHSFKRNTVDLQEVVRDTLKMIKCEIPSRVEIRVELPEQLILDLDKTRMEQALMNLVINGIHAMGDEGVLTISGNFAPDLSAVILEVADTGGGIPEKDLLHIFDPFFTTKPVGKGTGLGLSLVYDIVTRHDGTISVASEPGKGTRFTIRLPQEKALAGEGRGVSH